MVCSQLISTATRSPFFFFAFSSEADIVQTFQCEAIKNYQLKLILTVTHFFVDNEVVMMVRDIITKFYVDKGQQELVAGSTNSADRWI
jgi:hypothetical protein